MPLRLKCRYCGYEFDVDQDDVDVDAVVDNVDEEGIEVVVSISVKCPRCGRRVLDSSETIHFEARR